MRLMAFSDVHADLEACDRLIEAGKGADLVIGAGDFAHNRERLDETMERLAPLDEKAIYVAGNNESVEELRAATKARVLHGESFELGWRVIVGIGCAVPPLPPMDWESCDLAEEEAGGLLAPFKHADILITHSPPKGVADIRDGEHLGSEAVRAAIELIQPGLVLCGHVHDAWGVEARVGASRVVNLGPKPVWFEI